MDFSNRHQQNLTIYITSIEEHEEYQIKMYDFNLILHKENPKCNKIINSIEINKAYLFSVDNDNEKYSIIDVHDMKYPDFVEFNTVIKSITNDVNMNTIVKTGSLLPVDIILDRRNKAYCSIYNKLKPNVPCCLMIYDTHFLIGISDVKIVSEQIKVRGLINIDIEFDNLHNYQEVVAFDSRVRKRRMVFPKNSFEFKVEHNYEIKYEKMTQDYLYKIIESKEV